MSSSTRHCACWTHTLAIEPTFKGPLFPPSAVHRRYARITRPSSIESPDSCPRQSLPYGKSHTPCLPASNTIIYRNITCGVCPALNVAVSCPRHMSRAGRRTVRSLIVARLPILPSQSVRIFDRPRILSVESFFALLLLLTGSSNATHGYFLLDVKPTVRRLGHDHRYSPAKATDRYSPFGHATGSSIPFNGFMTLTFHSVQNLTPYCRFMQAE